MPVDERHASGYVGEVESFLDACGATTHNADILAAVEKPSHVAEEDMPRPVYACCDGKPRYFTDTPVAITRASPLYALLSPLSLNGRVLRSTVWM